MKSNTVLFALKYEVILLSPKQNITEEIITKGTVYKIRYFEASL